MSYLWGAGELLLQDESPQMGDRRRSLVLKILYDLREFRESILHQITMYPYYWPKTRLIISYVYLPLSAG